VVSIFAGTLTAQVTPPEESGASMINRYKQDLRGPIKSCVSESTFAGMTDADGKELPPVRSESTTEYDTDGRLFATRNRNSDGSQWVERSYYDPSGQLLKTTSGLEGQATTETLYSYDRQGRLQNITDSDKPDSPIAFHYDDQGRKNRVKIFSPADYRPNVATGGSPFEAADRVPNLPGGGSSITIYDEHDRATEVQVRDASGELVQHAVRTFNAEGQIVEEKLILDNIVSMFPPEVRAQILAQSGLSADQLRQELRAQTSKLMGDQYSVSYGYDAQGRLNHVDRRTFNLKDDIETTYNEHGDPASEITRITRAGEADPTTPDVGMPSFSETRYSYKYDSRENWTEQAISYRSSPDGPFHSSSVTKRMLTYY
jgi:YD repeat-containing protein